MIHRQDGNVIVCKIEKDEDVFQSIENLAKIYGINAGIIVSGIGMLKNFEIGYYNGRDYEKKFMEKNHELVAMHGSIASDDPKIHIHVGLAGPDHSIIGGHLLSAKADPFVELTVIKVSGKFSRIYNEKTGLKELNVL